MPTLFDKPLRRDPPRSTALFDEPLRKGPPRSTALFDELLDSSIESNQIIPQPEVIPEDAVSETPAPTPQLAAEDPVQARVDGIQRKIEEARLAPHPTFPSEESISRSAETLRKEELIASLISPRDVDGLSDLNPRNPNWGYRGPITGRQAPGELNEAINSAARAFVETLAAFPEFGGIVQKWIGNDTPSEEMMMFRMSGAIKEYARVTFPNNPDVRDRFINQMLPGAIGSMVAFMIPGTGAAKATAGAGKLIQKIATFSTTGLAGAAVSASGIFDRAIAEGKTQAEALKEAGWGIPLGATEMFTISKWITRGMGPGQKQTLARMLKTGLVEGLEEAFQESVQKAGVDAVAKDLSLMEGLGDFGKNILPNLYGSEEARAGAIAGFMMSLTMSALSGSKFNASTFVQAVEAEASVPAFQAEPVTGTAAIPFVGPGGETLSPAPLDAARIALGEVAPVETETLPALAGSLDKAVNDPQFSADLEAALAKSGIDFDAAAKAGGVKAPRPLKPGEAEGIQVPTSVTREVLQKTSAELGEDFLFIDGEVDTNALSSSDKDMISGDPSVQAAFRKLKSTSRWDQWKNPTRAYPPPQVALSERQRSGVEERIKTLTDEIQKLVVGFGPAIGTTPNAFDGNVVKSEQATALRNMLLFLNGNPNFPTQPSHQMNDLAKASFDRRGVPYPDIGNMSESLRETIVGISEADINQLVSQDADAQRIFLGGEILKSGEWADYKEAYQLAARRLLGPEASFKLGGEEQARQRDEAEREHRFLPGSKISAESRSAARKIIAALKAGDEKNARGLVVDLNKDIKSFDQLADRLSQISELEKAIPEAIQEKFGEIAAEEFFRTRKTRQEVRGVKEPRQKRGGLPATPSEIGAERARRRDEEKRTGRASEREIQTFRGDTQIPKAGEAGPEAKAPAPSTLPIAAPGRDTGRAMAGRLDRGQSKGQMLPRKLRKESLAAFKELDLPAARKDFEEVARIFRMDKDGLVQLFEDIKNTEDLPGYVAELDRQGATELADVIRKHMDVPQAPAAPSAPAPKAGEAGPEAKAAAKSIISRIKAEKTNALPRKMAKQSLKDFNELAEQYGLTTEERSLAKQDFEKMAGQFSIERPVLIDMFSSLRDPAGRAEFEAEFERQGFEKMVGLMRRHFQGPDVALSQTVEGTEAAPGIGLRDISFGEERTPPGGTPPTTTPPTTTPPTPEAPSGTTLSQQKPAEKTVEATKAEEETSTEGKGAEVAAAKPERTKEKIFKDITGVAPNKGRVVWVPPSEKHTKPVRGHLVKVVNEELVQVRLDKPLPLTQDQKRQHSMGTDLVNVPITSVQLPSNVQGIVEQVLQLKKLKPSERKQAQKNAKEFDELLLASEGFITEDELNQINNQPSERLKQGERKKVLLKLRKRAAKTLEFDEDLDPNDAVVRHQNLASLKKHLDLQKAEAAAPADADADAAPLDSDEPLRTGDIILKDDGNLTVEVLEHKVVFKNKAGEIKETFPTGFDPPPLRSEYNIIPAQEGPVSAAQEDLFGEDVGAGERPRVRGETDAPQVEQGDLLGPLKKAKAASEAERAQEDLGLDPDAPPGSDIDAETERRSKSGQLSIPSGPIDRMFARIKNRIREKSNIALSRAKQISLAFKAEAIRQRAKRHKLIISGVRRELKKRGFNDAMVQNDLNHLLGEEEFELSGENFSRDDLNRMERDELVDMIRAAGGTVAGNVKKKDAATMVMDLANPLRMDVDAFALKYGLKSFYKGRLQAFVTKAEASAGELEALLREAGMEITGKFVGGNQLYSRRFYMKHLSSTFIPSPEARRNATNYTATAIEKGIRRLEARATRMAKKGANMAAFFQDGNRAHILSLSDIDKQKAHAMKRVFDSLGSAKTSISQGPGGDVQINRTVRGVVDAAQFFVNEILSPQPEGVAGVSSGMGRSADALLHRDLKKVYRELFGEVKDPAYRFAVSREGQDLLINNLANMSNLGRTSGLFSDTKQEGEPNGHSIRLGASQESGAQVTNGDIARFGIMAGKWVHPAVAATMRSKQDLPALLNAVAKISGELNRLGGIVRGMMVLRPASILRDATTNITGFAMMAGDVNPTFAKEYIKTLATLERLIQGKLTKNVPMEEKARLELEAIMDGEIFRYQQSSLNEGMKGILGEGNPIGDTWNNLFAFRAMVADMAVKAAGYKSRLTRLRRWHASDVAAGTTTDEDLKQMARDHISRRYDNRDAVPAWFRRLSQEFWMRDYATFSYSGTRAYINSIIGTWVDMMDPKIPIAEKPLLFAQTAAGAGGTLAAVAMFRAGPTAAAVTAMAGLFAKLHDDEVDDLEILGKDVEDAIRYMGEGFYTYDAMSVLGASNKKIVRIIWSGSISPFSMTSDLLVGFFDAGGIQGAQKFGKWKAVQEAITGGGLPMNLKNVKKLVEDVNAFLDTKMRTYVSDAAQHRHSKVRSDAFQRIWINLAKGTTGWFGRAATGPIDIKNANALVDRLLTKTEETDEGVIRVSKTESPIDEFRSSKEFNDIVLSGILPVKFTVYEPGDINKNNFFKAFRFRRDMLDRTKATRQARQEMTEVQKREADVKALAPMADWVHHTRILLERIGEEDIPQQQADTLKSAGYANWQIEHLVGIGFGATSIPRNRGVKRGVKRSR